jgi:1,2-diacylglycerol 3-alpha-glucosyltransferase
MNIGIVTTWFERGAAYVSRQYRDVLKTRHNVFIYARGGESYAIGDPIWDNEYITWAKNPHIPIPMAIDYEDFSTWIKRNRLEVVFFNEQQWWDPVLWANDLGVKTGAYVDYYTEETIPLFGCYDFLICNTKRHLSAFEWHPQVIYIPWGTDVNTFSPKMYNLVNPGRVTFFHSAGFSPYRKGTDLVIKAFSKLIGEAHLVIHSQKNLKECFPELISEIENLEQKKQLICFEKTVSAPGLFYTGDIYVYPSRLEGIGLTIAEALSCGLPVVTADHPPMNEFIDGTNGKVVKISRFYSRSDGYYWPQCSVDLDSLRESMQYYVDNINLVPEFKQKARAYAEQYLNWADNSSKLPELFYCFERLSVVEKAETVEKAKAFEQKRLSMKQKLSLRFPLIFRILDGIWRIVKKLKLDK